VSGALADTTVSDRSPLPDTGTLAGDIRAHPETLVNDLTGENRRFVRRALIIAGNETGEGAYGQQALLQRTEDEQPGLGAAAGSRRQGEPAP
jgi:hypothetical protein